MTDDPRTTTPPPFAGYDDGDWGAARRKWPRDERTIRLEAERIVQFFDAWYNRCSEYRDDPIFQKARESYSRLKRTHDFATSSRTAKVEAVQEILQHG